MKLSVTRLCHRVKMPMRAILSWNKEGQPAFNVEFRNTVNPAGNDFNFFMLYMITKHEFLPVICNKSLYTPYEIVFSATDMTAMQSCINLVHLSLHTRVYPKVSGLSQ